MDDVELSARKKVLLYSAIDNYIKLASPITSLLVQQTNLHDLSTATIRNELNALEAMGYLKQLHTSSGRVPTTKGYRFFVDETLKSAHFDSASLSAVKDKMFSRTSNLSEIMDNISRAISSTTNYPTVLLFDGFDNLLIESIKVIYLLSSQVLVLIETNAGAISHTISCSTNLSRQDCDNASNLLSSLFSGKSMKYLTNNVPSFNETIKQKMAEYEEVFDLVLKVVDIYYNDTKSKVTNQGIIKLLESPGMESVEKAKNILTILDDENSLKDIMGTNSDEISVHIGKENNNDKLMECAVIKAPLVLDGKRIATVGVIGPERIDYATISSVLKFVADEVRNKGKGGSNE